VLSTSDLLVIVAVAVGSSLVVGAAGLAVLLVARRVPLLARVATVALTALASIVLGSYTIMRAMYVSEHDYTVFLAVAAASSAASLAVAFVVGGVLAREGARLRRLAHAVGDGRPLDEIAVRSRRARRGQSAELAAVADELVSASERLEAARAEVAALDASRRELVAWISHDLRTPLAGLRAMSEALEDGLVAEPERFHRQIRAQVDRLSSMVDDLFELSKINSGSFRPAHDEVRLYDLVSDAVADLRLVAAAREISLRETGAPGIAVLGDARELTRVVENLLANAIQHSPPGSEIVVSIDRDGTGGATLSVVDAGGGIADEDLAEVFRAGWRGTPARTPHAVAGRSGNAGLGLAIVQGIVRAHDGEVSVRNVEGGCRFDVRLPAAV